MTAAVAYLLGTPREHVVDPETLRDVPTRPADLAGWLTERQDEPIPLDPAAERRYRTDIGVAARMAGQLDLAEQQLFVAAELAARESPATALRARIRLAQVWQWQGRLAAAGAEFDDCVAAAATPADRALAHQHAGRCAYDGNDFDRAAGHFHAALRLRMASGAEHSLIESCRIALDAADTSRTALATAAELDRLVPEAHQRIRHMLRNSRLLPERPLHFGVLVELRALLLAGPVSNDVVAGLFRYEPRIDDDITELADEGWLTRDDDTIAATPRCVGLLEWLMAAASIALRAAWGRPIAEVAMVDKLVRGAVGTSAGPVFDALATVDPQGGPAVRLFERCNALRHHRADAHAAAWASVGLTATSVTAVPIDDPVRRDVERATNRVASRPYRSLSTVERAELVRLLRGLPGPAGD